MKYMIVRSGTSRNFPANTGILFSGRRCTRTMTAWTWRLWGTEWSRPVERRGKRNPVYGLPSTNTGSGNVRKDDVWMSKFRNGSSSKILNLNYAGDKRLLPQQTELQCCFILGWYFHQRCKSKFCFLPGSVHVLQHYLCEIHELWKRKLKQNFLSQTSSEKHGSTRSDF